MDKSIREMTLGELAQLIHSLQQQHNGVVPQKERDEIVAVLMSHAWTAAEWIDRANGTERGHTKFGGTANHRSVTYKVRKALGYSYP